MWAMRFRALTMTRGRVFPPDLMSIAIVVATQARGTVLFF